MQRILMITGWGMGTSILMPLKQKMIECGYKVELINIFNLFDPEVLKKHLQLATQFDVILGWSLGGQIATYLADQIYQQTGTLKTLITLASNPCFIRDEHWQIGMEQATFASLKASFDKDPMVTIKRFYYLVTQGGINAKQDWQGLQSLIQLDDFSQQRESLEMWEKLNCVDVLKKYKGQQLHIFFEADGLVPYKIIDLFKLLEAKFLKVDTMNGAHGYALFNTKEITDKISHYLKRVSKTI